MLRRRISVIGQMAFRASYALSENRTVRHLLFAPRRNFNARSTFEISRCAGPVSPAEFSLSVHNALARSAFDRVKNYRRSYDDLRRRRQLRFRDARYDWRV